LKGISRAVKLNFPACSQFFSTSTDPSSGGFGYATKIKSAWQRRLLLTLVTPTVAS
jgi:hypothetical protein